MNLKTTQINTRVKKKRKSVRNRKKGNFSIGTFFKFVFPLTVIFALAAVMTYFNSETEKLNRRTSKLKSDIHKFDRKIDNLKIHQESLKGRYILKQVARFKLKLASPKPGQVKKLEIRRRSVSRSSVKPESLLVSRR